MRTPEPPGHSPLQITKTAQRMAADPAVSAWVSANAGAGKTHVLVMRLLRLLLAGTAPERILCLTYTKAAAAEMSNRVLARLAIWVTMDEDRLADDMVDLLGRAPVREETLRARDLFAVAMETPGGLKVQTIHAFCERLLQRFPLEAGVPPNFTVLEDDEGRRLRIRATEDVLMQAVSSPESELGRAHRLAVTHAVEDRFDEVLREALKRQDVLVSFSRDDYAEVLEHCLRSALGIGRDTSFESLEVHFTSLLDLDVLRRAHDVLSGGSSTDRDRAREIDATLEATTHTERIAAIDPFFRTGKGEVRKSLMTRSLATNNAALSENLRHMQNRFCTLCDERDALAVLETTRAIMLLAGAISQRYTELKRARALLDFDDLIRHSSNLLAHTAAADWVHYKLDGGLDHILVDEAQDTSPDQWTIVTSLAAEFFAGRGTRENDSRPRTLFAVGDEKQSIYGFQGAAPHLFAEVGQRMQELARSIGSAWHNVPLTLSFRSVGPVLEAVDSVFADPLLTPGVRAAIGADRVVHASNRPGSAGLVELWDPEPHRDPPAVDAWSHEAPEPPPGSADALAARIADTIRHWLDTGERLQSEDRPISAGDILILVRRRRPFADKMVAALEARDIPVAGSDRMRLTEQLAVQDLIVLGNFLLLPEDDLALATVLKSPLFGFDDDALLHLAPGRRGTLWSALLQAARQDRRFVEAADTLKRWRARADVVPPYEFFVEVLDHDGMRRRMLSRLGVEAADAIDEFLALALASDETAPPSLQEFIHRMGSAEREVKRDMEHGRDEVRVMTVHGAKGLETPIVFLPDTCSAMTSSRGSGLLDLASQARPAGLPTPFIWPVGASRNLAAVRNARQQSRTRDTEEMHRLLYVAMTRARDRLYIAGFESKTRPRERWYDLVAQSLAVLLEDVPTDARPLVRRVTSPQTSPPELRRSSTVGDSRAEPLPAWAQCRAPAEPARLIPIAPSRLAPLDTDADGDPVDTARPRGSSLSSPSSPTADHAPDRFLRGIVTHALLQHLPAVEPASWSDAARRFVDVRGAQLSVRARQSIVEETLAILTDPAFADLFGPASRAEVPLVAEFPPPAGVGGPNLRITGQIDRLVQLPDRVLIVDYKTNRPPPRALEAVPESYMLQLAAYCLAVEQIFPRLPVHAALLWTDGPRIMDVPHDMLQRARERLFSAPMITVD